MRNSEMFCNTCNKICEVILIDEGCSTSEFWGSMESQQEYTEVSECCRSENLYELDEAFEELGDKHLQQDLF